MADDSTVVPLHACKQIFPKPRLILAPEHCTDVSLHCLHLRLIFKIGFYEGRGYTSISCLDENK